MKLLKINNFSKSGITKVNEKFLLTIYAKPNSKKEGIYEINDELIIMCIKAPALEGKANAAIIEFLSESLDLSKSRIKLERGSKNKNKVVSIEDSGFKIQEDIINKLKQHMI